MDGNVILLQAIKNSRSVSLYCTVVQMNSLEKSVQGYIARGQNKSIGGKGRGRGRKQKGKGKEEGEREEEEEA